MHVKELIIINVFSVLPDSENLGIYMTQDPQIYDGSLSIYTGIVSVNRTTANLPM